MAVEVEARTGAVAADGKHPLGRQQTPKMAANRKKQQPDRSEIQPGGARHEAGFAERGLPPMAYGISLDQDRRVRVRYSYNVTICTKLC